MKTASIKLLDTELLETLIKLNQVNKTYVIGGHLRNLFYERPETDVDFLTMLTLEELKNIFPRLTFTERGLEFGVCRVSFRNRQFDFSLCSDEEEFQLKLIDRDFTVNTVYADGNAIYYPGSSYEDLQNKTLKPAFSMINQFLNSDKLLVRTYRLIAEFGFEVDTEVHSFLENYKDTLNDINRSMLTEEFYRLLKGEFVFKALAQIWEIYFPEEHDSFLENNMNTKLPLIGDNLKARLIYIDFISGTDLIPELLELFDLQEVFSIDFDESRAFLKDHTLIPPNLLSLYLLVKRYETKDDPVELAKFLSSLKKQK